MRANFLDDGVKDRIVSHPQACRFDPSTLRCGKGTTAGCLSQTKIDAIRKIYEGPRTSKGMPIYTGGPVPGSELDWIEDNRLYSVSGDAGRR